MNRSAVKIFSGGVINGLRRSFSDEQISKLLGLPIEDVQLAGSEQTAIPVTALEELERITQKSAAQWALDSVDAQDSAMLREAKLLLDATTTLAVGPTNFTSREVTTVLSADTVFRGEISFHKSM